MILPEQPTDILRVGRSIRAERNLGGFLQLRIGVHMSTSITIMLTENEAISLCDQMRSVLSDPTLGKPSGENVVIMGGNPR